MNIRDCYFDYEHAVLMRFWLSRKSTIRSTANQVLVLEEKATVPCIPKPDKRVEFGLGFSD